MLAGRLYRPFQQRLKADGALLACWSMQAHVLLADLICRISWHLEDVRYRELLLCQGTTAADAPDRQQEGIDGKQPLADCLVPPATDLLKDLLSWSVALHVQLELCCCEVDCRHRQLSSFEICLLDTSA